MPENSADSEHRSQFDVHVEDYEARCMQGLRLSGESAAYFAAGRLAYLRDWWIRTRRAAPRRVVDLGCGIGEGTALIHDFFPEADVLGVDPSERCIDHARRHHGSSRVSFATTDELRAGAAADADLVHVNGVVHHVPPAERREFFNACAELLVADAVVALFENNPLNPGTRLVMARIPFDRDAVAVPFWEAQRRLVETGLRVVETGHLFFFPRFLRALRPLERHLVRLPLGAQYGVIAIAPGRDAV